MSQLLAGTGRADITPAPGTPQGTWGAQTHQRGIGADLPLHATALVLSDSIQSAAILDVDAIGFPPDLAEQILAAVEGLTGIPRAHIRLSATHTHSGPNIHRLYVVTEGLDMARQYIDALPLRLAGAVWEAQRNLRPVRCGAASGACAINVNRRLRLDGGAWVVGRNPDGPVDRTVRVVRFDDLAERPVATLVHYACHPTIMAWENEWFTPDYPGVVRQVVEREVGGACLFLQGAAGNIGPIRGFTGDRSVYRRLGTILGLEAAKLACGIETLPRREHVTGVLESGASIALYDDRAVEPPPPALRLRSKTLKLPANRFPPAADMEREAQSLAAELASVRQSGSPDEIRAAAARATRAGMRAQRARMLEGKTCLDRLMQGIGIGGVALISIQDEPFIEIAQQIVAASPFPHTLFSGYSNGNSGYLPVRAAFDEGGYEVALSLYGPDAAEIVVREALEMLEDMAVQP